MLVDPRENLQKVMSRLSALHKLKDKVDPASGMSVLVRRGVLSDRAEDEDNRERRQYIEIETLYFMPEIIDLLIKGQEEHRSFWIKQCKQEWAALGDLLDKVTDIT
jgi:hypothetical protein